MGREFIDREDLEKIKLWIRNDPAKSFSDFKNSYLNHIKITAEAFGWHSRLIRKELGIKIPPRGTNLNKGEKISKKSTPAEKKPQEKRTYISRVKRDSLYKTMCEFKEEELKTLTPKQVLSKLVDEMNIRSAGKFQILKVEKPSEENSDIWEPFIEIRETH